MKFTALREYQLFPMMMEMQILLAMNSFCYHQTFRFVQANGSEIPSRSPIHFLMNRNYCILPSRVRGRSAPSYRSCINLINTGMIPVVSSAIPTSLLIFRNTQLEPATPAA